MNETLQGKWPATDSRRFINPWSASILLVVLTTAWLVLTGGEAWGQTNIYWPLSAEVWSRQNSQHPLDPYTLTHMLHGVLCYWLIKLTLPKLPLSRQFFLAIAFACGWELLENSSFVIERYRLVTASADYVGDAVINSAMDIVACGTGFFIGSGIGLRLSVFVFLAVELLMLFWVRDNLVLNVIMILIPTDSIKAWQVG